MKKDMSVSNVGTKNIGFKSSLLLLSFSMSYQKPMVARVVSIDSR